MKKLFILFSLCAVTISAAFCQNGQYYTGDEATVTEKAQQAPPALPEYIQPPCPEDGYLWTPGHWAWGRADYYWVPGVWVLPPAAGLLWTPGYWGFYNNYYGWHPGYWGEHVGYYGGINYGFGYPGLGFVGGKWEDGAFQYNTSIWRVNTAVIHHTYVGKENINNKVKQASFNGPGGVKYRPMANEEGYMQEKHIQATKEQVGHSEAASHDKRQYAHTNGGKAAYRSMSKPGGQRFDEHGNTTHGGGGRR